MEDFGLVSHYSPFQDWCLMSHLTSVCYVGKSSGPHLQVCKMGKIQVKHKFLLWEIWSRQQRNTTLWRHHNLDELWFHSSQVAVTTQTLIYNSLVLQSVKNKNNKPTNQEKPQKQKNQINQIKKPSPNKKTNSPNHQQTNTKNPEEKYFTF